jgi:hypothetical protein
MMLARPVTTQSPKPGVTPQGRVTDFGPSATINTAIEAWKQNGEQNLSPTTTRRYTSKRLVKLDWPHRTA